ncbi:GNAT family N-acetyltransferase [Sporosarcina sp. BI001-red]|uniref:GNAT family N-acetyltransferase n=1 Tax=Sporosarcina sp. BI001-red TaxID=2282866 RepID=UPI000E269694|nr:GNAT family N-acetyltransferase [Sporosarcina sp. BI001-red]REB05149.1 GNAT family N-acetyltransferase [Sporosarcina sp. BI001-red]
MNYSIRPLEVRDVPFLWEMLYQSIYVPEGHQAPRREIVKEQSIAKYLEDWGSDHDYAFIALDGQNHPVGAVWIRIFNYENAGYGFIDDVTPELGMAIMPQHRGYGVGKDLLAKIIDFARSNGYPALSLSVGPINKVALQLYEKSGFQKVYQDDGGSWTMKVEL